MFGPKYLFTVQCTIVHEPLLSVHRFTSPSIQTRPIFWIWIGKAKTCILLQINGGKAILWLILLTFSKSTYDEEYCSFSFDCCSLFCLLTNSPSNWRETNLSKLSLLSSTFQKSSIWKIPNKNQCKKSAHFNELTKTPIITTCCIVWYLPRADPQSELCACPFVCSWLYSFPTTGPAR